jgi:hypothetical protein
MSSWQRITTWLPPAVQMCQTRPFTQILLSSHQIWLIDIHRVQWWPCHREVMRLATNPQYWTPCRRGSGWWKETGSLSCQAHSLRALWGWAVEDRRREVFNQTDHLRAHIIIASLSQQYSHAIKKTKEEKSIVSSLKPFEHLDSQLRTNNQFPYCFPSSSERCVYTFFFLGKMSIVSTVRCRLWVQFDVDCEYSSMLIVSAVWCRLWVQFDADCECSLMSIVSTVRCRLRVQFDADCECSLMQIVSTVWCRLWVQFDADCEYSLMTIVSAVW